MKQMPRESKVSNIGARNNGAQSIRIIVITGVQRPRVVGYFANTAKMIAGVEERHRAINLTLSEESLRHIARSITLLRDGQAIPNKLPSSVDRCTRHLHNFHPTAKAVVSEQGLLVGNGVGNRNEPILGIPLKCKIC